MPPARIRVFVGVRKRARPNHAAHVDVVAHGVQEPAARFVLSDDAHHAGRTAERGDVARRVAGAARDNLRRIVIEDEDGRLARHARDVAVDELVDDEIAEDGRSHAGEAVDELEQAARINRCRGRSSHQDARRIQETAAIRLSTTAAGRTPAFGDASWDRP